MLKYLHIENVAVIEQADIELSPGFNVLTGETGAGKSIIIDSLSAVLGQRTSKDIIRSGCDRAEVSALFCDLSEKNKATLSEFGFAPDEDGNLLISRIIANSGQGYVRVNGKPATVGVLKDICENLVNIHGQHDNQGLLNPDNHISYIDSIADDAVLRDAYYKEFKHLNAVRKQLTAEETDEDEKERKTELLTFQIKELSEADIKPGEAQTLKKQLEIARNYEKIRESLSNALTCIYGTDDTDGAISMLENAGKYISSAGDDYSKILQKITEAKALLEDIGSLTDDSASSLDESQTDVAVLSDRLDLIYKLTMKYGGSEERLFDFLENAKIELEKITLSDKRIAELSDEMDASAERLVALGEKLTAARKKAGEFFSGKVCERLEYLDMHNVKFGVNIEKGKYMKNGCDAVEFMIGTNIGEAAKPLSKIASGGELSRIMLAIKSILADKDNVDTLIFDEVDTGVSGKAAGRVGKMLEEVSRSRQVICVTHLAQICACADTHFHISKKVDNSRTYTEVTRLDREGRIREIARIMSGDKITENLYNSAEELLDGGIL